ncbi:YlxR family protein [Lolliginicoccus suaedae]|uniref:YlxR family protein n=1 Tax=Lolliginicoccus suaedae TaxID=2605429 RepID=UPI0011EC196E|nr:YlxR family protein [Lolliginicoccus suaedae]
MPLRPAHMPVRTCVGCRRRTFAADLLRIVALQGDEHRFCLAPDPHQVLPGRGAWLHPTTQCLDKAVKRRAFGKALRRPGNVDTTELDRFVRDSPPPAGGWPGRCDRARGRGTGSDEP